MHKAVKENELKTWLRFFGSKDFEKEKEVIAMQGEVFKKAVGDYEYFRADKDLVSEYEKREIYLSRQYQMVSLERQMAREEGHAEGHAEGLSQGERNAKIEIAKNLLEQGLSFEQVVHGTGLSEEEILAIPNT